MGYKKELKAHNDALRDGVEYYKEILATQRKHTKYSQEYSNRLYEGSKAYMMALKEEGKPITLAGLILASGVSRRQWFVLKNGESDYQLAYFMDTHDCDDVYEYDGMPCCDVDGQRVILLPLSEIIERLLLIKEDETETRLYEKGRVADIFALKAGHGWVEEEKAPRTLNQTLVIASDVEARKALEMLK